MTALNAISVGPALTTKQAITLTERALVELRKILEEEQPGDDTGLRLAVTRGGCSGMSYEMDFTEARPGDIEVCIDDLTLYLDAESSVFFNGATLDYQGGLRGRGFTFSNPNAGRTCSCGDSFGL